VGEEEEKISKKENGEEKHGEKGEKKEEIMN
jgi:hypothetical protein